MRCSVTSLKPDRPIIDDLLNVDLYKPTMSQVQFLLHPDVDVTFEFTNRSTWAPLAKVIDPGRLREELDALEQARASRQVLDFLSTVKGKSGKNLFGPQWLAYMETVRVPPIDMETVGDQFRIRSTGKWPSVTFVETLIMKIVNHLYFEALREKDGLHPGTAALEAHYDEGMRRLDDKIRRIKKCGARIMEFGDRRQNSHEWHRRVLARLARELGPQLLGTSNVKLAMELGIRPMGTFAHEMFMVYSAIYRATHQELISSHGRVLADWRGVYGDDLSVALTDTYGSEFFFRDMIRQVAELWEALRHDSGDPFVFGERAIAFYQQMGIDPMTKTLVYSDGLTVEVIEELTKRFGGRINLVFGWGTDLTNDLGYRTLSIVMKAVEACGLGTVKLSDNPAKAQGLEDLVALFKYLFGYQESAYVECQR